MNTSNVANSTIWTEYRTSLTIWFAFMLTAGIIGAILNFLLIVAIMSKPRLRSGSGMLILNSLVINFILCAVEMPMMAASAYFGESTPFKPTHYCRYLILFYYYHVYAANWAQLLIGVNRFIAVLFPHIYATWTKPPMTFAMIVLPHLIPFVCTTVMFFDVGAHIQVMRPWGACGLQPTPGSSVYTSVIWVCVAIPIVIVFVLYSIIFLMVWTKSMVHSRQVTDVNAAGQPTFRKRYRTVKVLFWTAMFYAVALIPAPIGSSFFAAQFNSMPFMQLFLRALLLFCYATTPLIYLAKTADYRRCVVKLAMIVLPCVTSRQSVTPASISLNAKVRSRTGITRGDGHPVSELNE
ncbi:probable G-protein coupled receptor B0563.6 [Paramacrobiotus metropolitanus]|uniref:probable G-protein coupled receptor B0563.6 n=1 Tax=Paramacrobiotus metropolitanus TaxID=2943436 RepID=UPI002445E53B|nr:probable G-protein coupled receptor B0563.6 [Paramacrobiotus metropolitanus]